MRILLYAIALLSSTAIFAQKTQFKYHYSTNESAFAKFRLLSSEVDEQHIYQAIAQLDGVDHLLMKDVDGFYTIQLSNADAFLCDKLHEALSPLEVTIDPRSIYVFDKQLLTVRPDEEVQFASRNVVQRIIVDGDQEIHGSSAHIESRPEGTAITFTAGNVHSIQVEQTQNSLFPVNGKAWIDFNQDGKFSGTEALGKWNGNSTFQFRVPQEACNGWHTLRFVQAEGETVLMDRPYFISNTLEVLINIQNGTCEPDYFKLPDGNQDCDDAQPLCQEDYEQTTSPPGEGNNSQELTATSTSCFSPSGSNNSYEQNSVWYTFTTPNTGNLAFTITPNDPNDDYDWVVFDITGFSCADLATNSSLEVSCNFSGTSGPTGPNGQGSTNSQGGGGTPFNLAIPVTAGNTYVILVNNWSLSDNGYSIDYGASTADVYATDLNTTDQEICKGDSVLLQALYTGATFGQETYTWSPDTLLYSPTNKNTLTKPLYDDTLTFYVSLNLGQCDFTDSLIVYTYSSYSEFEVEYDSILSPVEVQFTNNSAENTVAYSWDFGNEIISDKRTPENQFYLEPGEYIISLITENELGCLDTSYQTIVVPPFSIPNVITPNNDGFNDKLVITGLKENTNLTVYNRWGKKVTEVFGFNNDWDGGDLSDGTYYYIVSVQEGVSIENFGGWVQILR